LDLTTQERLIAVMGETNYQAEYAKFLSQIITGVSKSVEKELRRHAEAVERTVQIDVNRHSTSISLKGYPITSVSTIQNDPSRVYPVGTSVDPVLYYVDLEAGIISFDFELLWGPGAAKVTYTGGMAAGADEATRRAAFIAAYPDLVMAIDQQIYYLWSRRDNPGVINKNPSDFGGGASYLVSEEWAEKYGEFQPMLVEAIKDYRNDAVNTW
jgi:hypothetical protein